MLADLQQRLGRTLTLLEWRSTFCQCMLLAALGLEEASLGEARSWPDLAALNSVEGPTQSMHLII
jgi:hypothetical protein